MQYKRAPLYFAALISSLISGTSHATWTHNTELFFAASDDASAGGIRWLKPWWQNGKAMAFSDFRYIASDKNTEEFNIGGGYRQFNKEETAIWGAYGFLDYRLSATNKKFPQITLGTEYLLDKWEFRSNFYLPLKDEYILGTLPDQRPQDQYSFIGHFVNRVTTIVPGGQEVEEALQGFDIEAGYLLPGSEDFEIRANIGLYSFSAPVAGDANGLRARIEAFPRENFRVSFSIENDELFETRSFLELTMPLGRRIGRPGKRSLHKRMTQFAYRDLDVRETSRLDITKRTKNGPGSAQAIANTRTETTQPEEAIVHIDGSRNIANADGSFERPYNTVADCVAATANRFHCGANNDDTKTIYLHARQSGVTNGVARHYIGNLSLSSNQKLIGDGITEGTFSNLSTKVSPILIGSASIPTPDDTAIVTLSENASLGGLQLGWTYSQTAPGSSSASTNPLPTGGHIPKTAVYIRDAESINISDLSITGFNGQTPGSFDAVKNFETGIHFFSDSNDTRSIASIERLKADFVLGDAVYAQVSLSADSSTEQTLTIRDSEIRLNGRGVHASVASSFAGASHTQQNINIISSNPSSETIANQIQLNFNEGVLVENLNTLNDADFSNIVFTAEQDLTVNNTQIESNQGAGIQTLLGPAGVTGNNQARVSDIKLNFTSITRNDGSGLVLGSKSAKVEAELKNTLFSANLLVNRTGGNSFGKRLDLSAIDCGTSAGDGDACGTPGDNAKRTGGFTPAPNSFLSNYQFRKTGYGIYAQNLDTSAVEGTQSISILEDFTNTLHHRDSAQIFLDSSNMNNDNSLQTITLRAADVEPDNTDDKENTNLLRLFNTVAGQSEIVNGSIVTGIDTSGASTPQIAFCDFKTTDPASAKTDNDSPHIDPYGGDLSGIAKVERNCP